MKTHLNYTIMKYIYLNYKDVEWFVFSSMAHQTHLNLCLKASLHSHCSLNHRKMQRLNLFQSKMSSHRQDNFSSRININFKKDLQKFCNPLGYTIITHMQKILRETQSSRGTWKEFHQNPMKILLLIKDWESLIYQLWFVLLLLSKHS